MTASSSRAPEPTKVWMVLRCRPAWEGDRLAGLAFQAAEEPVEDLRAGIGAVFDAVEPRGGSVAGRRSSGPGSLGAGGVGQEDLGHGVIQEAHGEPSGPVVDDPG